METITPVIAITKDKLKEIIETSIQIGKYKYMLDVGKISEESYLAKIRSLVPTLTY